MTLSSQELIVNLRKITTVDWAYKAANVLERIFWASIGIIGISWGVYFITMQVGSDLEIMMIEYEFNHCKSLQHLNRKHQVISNCSILSLPVGIVMGKKPISSDPRRY